MSLLSPIPKLVLFDLDHTLADSDTARERRMRYAFSPAIPDPEQLRSAITASQAIAIYSTDHFADVLAPFGVTDPDDLAAIRSRFESDPYRGLELFPESLEMVRLIRNVASIGMITNGPSAMQWPKIRLLGLEEYFPVIIVSGDVDIWKPDPRIFHLALERLDIDPSDAAYVGDSPQHDIVGAQAAGLQSIWLNRVGATWPGGPLPDAEINSLRELPSLLGLPQPDEGTAVWD